MNGQLVRPHSWPWQAYMLACTSPNSGCTFCGGSLIAEDKVLTAAHCVNKRNTGLIAPSAIKIRLGTDNTRDPVGSENGDIQVGVKSIAVHSGWSFGTFENDVAILTLDTKVTYTKYISPACVATTDPPAGTVCYATGWGYTESGWKDELYQVGIPISTDEDCKREVNGPIDGKLCFDVRGSKDTCQGDSGGPVVCKTYDGVWRIVGITSYGNSACGTDGRPGVYTRVSYYSKWIMSNVKQRQQQHRNRPGGPRNFFNNFK